MTPGNKTQAGTVHMDGKNAHDQLSNETCFRYGKGRPPTTVPHIAFDVNMEQSFISVPVFVSRTLFFGVLF